VYVLRVLKGKNPAKQVLFQQVVPMDFI